MTDEPKNERDLLNELKEVWRLYMDHYVIGNKELKELMFHVFLGVVLTNKKFGYIESGDKQCSTRIHAFIIQDSGTGKTQTMEALYNLVDFLKISCRKTIQDNEACLTGSVFQGKDNKTIKKEGILSKLKLLVWDEGSVLLSDAPHMNMNVLTSQFQHVMDEPGKVSKGMKYDVINYPCNCTVVAGSYMFDGFKNTILTKGFLQRMFLSYKEFTPEEEKEIRIGVELMKLQQNPEKIKKIREKIRTLTDMIPNKIDKYLLFDKEDVKKYLAIKESLYSKYIVGQFTGDKQRILKTFFQRFHVLVNKVATQRAVINGHERVNYEDIMYGVKVCEPNLKNLLQLFDMMYMGKSSSASEEKERIIIDIIKKHGQLTQKDLLLELNDKKKRGKWDLGYNRTLDIIKMMMTKNIILYQTGDKNSKILYVE